MSLHETVISFTSLYKYRERVKEKSSNILFVIVIHCLKTLQDFINWDILKDVHLPKVGCDWNDDFSGIY
jgi:hypothetical protein